VSDDGSTDGTAGLVKEFQEQGKKPTLYVLSPHGGVNSARNAGIKASSGDIVCFLDDDEIAPPSWVTEIVRFFSENPEVDIVGGDCRQFAPPRFRVCASCSDFGAHPAPPRQGPIEVFEGKNGVISTREGWMPPGGNQAICRELIDLVGLFDPTVSGYGDEREWQRRAAACGARFGVSTEMWIWHRREVQSVTGLARKAFGQSYRGERFERTRSTGLQHSVPLIIRSIAHWAVHSVYHRCGAGVVRVARGLGRLGAAVVPPFVFTTSSSGERIRSRPRTAREMPPRP
jgi:glycosyltransferase involved in cell wall biosynthesis